MARGNGGGRPRLPTALQEAKGAFKHDPSRLRDREGEPEVKAPPGPPPKYLSPKEKAIWVELVSKAHPGVLSQADEYLIETAVVLIAEFRIKRTSFNKHNQMTHVLGKLGMTPSDRSYVKAPPPAPRGFGAMRRRLSGSSH